MPELPEVETTLRGIENHLSNRTIVGTKIRHKQLRWPIPVETLTRTLPGQKLNRLTRRGKYIIFEFSAGSFLIHLGMSGTLRIVPSSQEPRTHDHFDLILDKGITMRLNDPRRFGAIVWGGTDPLNHRLLRELAPEPLSRKFSNQWLKKKLQGRKATIKSLIMNGSIVAGVGNIYANEILFRAKISPFAIGKDIDSQGIYKLVSATKFILRSAIKYGGSSVQDYVNPNGLPGYFQNRYLVYGRNQERCKVCSSTIIREILLQRATYYCENCQRK